MLLKQAIKSLCLIIGISIGCSSYSQASSNSIPNVWNVNKIYFHQLDSVISAKEEIKTKKEENLYLLKQLLAQSNSPEQKLNFYRMLISEYSTFDSDSANLFVNKALDFIHNNFPDNYNLIAELKLSAINPLALQGRFKEAQDILNNLNINLLNPDNKAAFFDRKAYLATMENVFMESPDTDWGKIIRQNNEWRDSILKSNPSDLKDWMWIPIAMKIEFDKDNNLSALPTDDEAIEILKSNIEENLNPSRLNAINAYWLYRYYKAVGDQDQMVKYLTLSAINDAAIDNHDPIATQDLAKWLFENGDLDRAYNYLSYAVNQANDSHFRVRMVELSQILPMVRKAYLEQINQRDKQLRDLIVALSIVALFLILSFFILGIFYFRLRKTKSKLDETINREKIINKELIDTVSQRDVAINNLGIVNSELQAANNQKLNLLTYAMRITADNINGLEEYRKKLLRKYRSKAITDLGVILDDPDLVVDKYKIFHSEFDKMVLVIMPDFYNLFFNAYPEESEENIKKQERSKVLTTKMRIFALRTLGVEKSEDIAKLLNLSLRTVYNNRVSNKNSEK